LATIPPVNAAIRVIELLQAMNRQPVCSIHWLHNATGIPKPTIVRLLQTLETRNIVRHPPQYGNYMLAGAATSLCSGYHGTPRIVEASADLLDEFTDRFRWPAALALYDHDAMVVRYSTIPHSPLSLQHSTINLRLSLTGRALGRAYLAFCRPEDRMAIIQIIAQSKNPEDGPARVPAILTRELEQIARDGYALRAPGVRPVSSTLAVPVFEDHQIVATIGLTWITSALGFQKRSVGTSNRCAMSPTG